MRIPVGIVLLASALPVLAAPAPVAELEARWRDEVLPVVERYCYDCHGEGIREGELDLEDYPDIASMQADRERWKRIRGHLDQKLMPPVDEDQPSADQRALLLEWIDAAVFPVDPENPDPGRVTIRRLNRTEYENTVHDLLGIRTPLKDRLPPDDSGYGFDHIGDVLTLSPTHLDRLLETARIALDEALHPDPMPFPRRSVAGSELEGHGSKRGRNRWLTTNGTVGIDHHFAQAGPYRVQLRAGGTPGNRIAPAVELRIDGEPAGTIQVDAAVDQPSSYPLDIRVADRGKHRIELSFTNDFFDPELGPEEGRDRNLMIERLEVIGPLDGPRLPKPESHRRVHLEREPGEADPDYLRRVLHAFASRAFRRPLAGGELERYLGFATRMQAEGAGLEESIRIALEAMLVSPAFLFREEPQPDPDDPGSIHAIDEHALASRLSYFLWSTMPDERLRQLADQGRLRAHLDSEIERLLDSPRSDEFVRHFAGQWLQLRDLAVHFPSRRHFPGWNRSLRDDMRRETELLFRELIVSDLPVTTLLDADFTFLNGKLARHYGIDGVEGRDFRRVEVESPTRRGLLGHGSFLLVTSHPTRTSPVLRGKFVLENLLDTAPPPPPPNVPQLEPPSRHGGQLSLREQMERHREDPSCAACHALLDPIGFGLEGFDAIGRWRDEENGKPIDDEGQLASGERFAGPAELREILLRHHREEFLRSVASRMLTYALGRGTDWYDRPAIDRIIREASGQGESTRAMIRAVIHSVPFQFRRGDR